MREVFDQLGIGAGPLGGTVWRSVGADVSVVSDDEQKLSAHCTVGMEAGGSSMYGDRSGTEPNGKGISVASDVYVLNAVSLEQTDNLLSHRRQPMDCFLPFPFMGRTILVLASRVLGYAGEMVPSFLK
jgi:hypothetical protein